MADNCEPRKIDSNKIGLSYAETICGVLPTLATDGRDPVWFELEPNSFADFGGGISTTARRPLSASRQRKKGVITDLNAAGGFNQDFTKSNFNRLMQGFLFADAHEKATTAPVNGIAVEVTGADAASDSYEADTGLEVFRAGMLVMVAGFTNPTNNGLKRITAVNPDAITVAEPLADETPTEVVTIQCVGWQLGAAAVNMTLTGALGTLVLAGGVPASSTGTITIADVVENDTVTVGGVEYNFTAAIVDPYDTLIGNTDAITAANLAAAINGNVVGTPANPLVTASAAGAVVTVTAIIPGLAGNEIALSEAATDVTLSGAALAGGTGFSFRELGLVEGEWVYLGGDFVANRLVNNTGFARIGSLGDQAITFDKTTFAPAVENGAGKGVQLFTGFTVKNEKDPELITTRYYEFERTLGRDADGIQTEYLTRAVLNEFTLNVPLPEGEDAKLNADVSFVSSDAEQRTGAEGRKPGLFVAAPGEDAINTASNIVRMRLAVLDPATSRPMPLFAYITEANLTVNNNVTPVKAIGTLGSIDVNVGDFDVGGEVTAIFSTILATRAVRQNADVTLDFIGAADNAGFVFDIPLLSLGGGIIDVEAGREVRIPLELFGAENENGYTLLYTSFPYLPTVAMPVAGTAY